MNRAILIVICDFLVSAMLSMMTGMVPAHTGGTGVGLDERTTRLLLGELELRQRELDNLRRQLREAAAQRGQIPDSTAAVKKITDEMIDNMRRIENIKRAQRATRHNTGVLSADELRNRLELEARKRLELEIRLRDQKLESRTAADKLELTRNILERERRRLDDTERKLADTAKAERSANAELRQLAADYRKVQQKLGSEESKRRLSERELAAARSAMAARDADLAGVKNALREMNSRIGKVSLERQELQKTLAFTSGKLNTAERDKADYKGQLLKLQRLAARQKMELAEAQRAREQMEVLVKRSMKDLSDARHEADENKSAAKMAEGKFAAAEKILKQVTGKPAAEAFKRYTKAAVKFSFTIREKGLVLERSVRGDYVPVLVKFGKRTLAVMPFDMMIGSGETAMLYRNITEVSYVVSTPDDKERKNLTSSLLAFRGAGGEKLGGIPVSFSGRTPLQLISRKQLIERGTDDLFLFSCRKYGRESAALGSRCSIDPRSGSPYLLIRNEKGRKTSQLNAGPGDIVITRDGGFVGVVTGFEKGNNPDAKVLLFADDNVWEKAVRIPAGKNAAGSFGDAVRKFRDVKGKK